MDGWLPHHALQAIARQALDRRVDSKRSKLASGRVEACQPGCRALPKVFSMLVTCHLPQLGPYEGLRGSV